MTINLKILVVGRGGEGITTMMYALCGKIIKGEYSELAVITNFGNIELTLESGRPCDIDKIDKSYNGVMLTWNSSGDSPFEYLKVSKKSPVPVFIVGTKTDLMCPDGGDFNVSDSFGVSFKTMHGVYQMFGTICAELTNTEY